MVSGDFSYFLFLGLPTSVARSGLGKDPIFSGFESIAEPLETRSDLMEADQDRCLALALFSTARTFEKQKRLADAVRHYQRAFRYDPSAKMALSSIVRLTKTVGWNDERLRYLTRLADLAPSEIDAAEIVDLVEALSPEKNGSRTVDPPFAEASRLAPRRIAFAGRFDPSLATGRVVSSHGKRFEGGQCG